MDQGLLTFCNVPRDSSQEHFARVDGVLVVSGRQLPAPGAGCFIHSLDKHKQHSVQDHLLPTPPQVSTEIPIFCNYVSNRAAAVTGSCPDTLPCLLPAGRPRVRLMHGERSDLLQTHVQPHYLHRGHLHALPEVHDHHHAPKPAKIHHPTHLLLVCEAWLLFQY